MVRSPPVKAGDVRDEGSILVGKILWRRAWQTTPAFLPGESHGQRSLVGCSPWSHKKSDTTEQLTLYLYYKQRNEWMNRQTELERDLSIVTSLENKGP